MNYSDMTIWVQKRPNQKRHSRPGDRPQEAQVARKGTGTPRGGSSEEARCEQEEA